MIGRIVVVALAVPACLGEPERPHGLGLPIPPGGVLRQKTAVGDLNGDGYDDLVTWGNEGAPGANPTAYVYFGGELLENPDVRAQLAVDDPAFSAWYEAVAVTITVSADRKLRGITALSAQDDTTTSNSREVFGQFFPADGRGLGARTTTARGFQRDWAGKAPDANADYAMIRDTVSGFPARELIIGGSYQPETYAAPFGPTSRGTDAGFTLPDMEYVTDVLLLPAEGTSEDLLVVGENGVYRTHGDLDPLLKSPATEAEYAHGPTIAYVNDHRGQRYVRGRALDDHFYVATNNQFVPDVAIIDVPAGGEPVAYELPVGVAPIDLAIANVGGDSLVDVVALAGNLGVYRDVTLGSVSQPAQLVGNTDPLTGYDMLAVGNFHGDARLEIYVLSATHPEQLPLCYRLGTTLERCDGE